MSNYYLEAVARLRGYARASKATMFTADQVDELANMLEEQQLALKAHHELATAGPVDVDQLVHQLHTLAEELLGYQDTHDIAADLMRAAIVLNRNRIRAQIRRAGWTPEPRYPEASQ